MESDTQCLLRQREFSSQVLNVAQQCFDPGRRPEALHSALLKEEAECGQPSAKLNSRLSTARRHVPQGFLLLSASAERRVLVQVTEDDVEVGDLLDQAFEELLLR